MTEINAKWGSNHLQAWPKPIEGRATPAESQGVALGDMTRAQLVEKAESMGDAIPASWNKQQIIDAFNTAGQSESDETLEASRALNETSENGAEDADEDEDEETQDAAPA